MSVVQSWQVFLNSEQRTSGANANPSFTLNPPLRLSRSTTAMEVRVQSCSIPFSFNQLNSSNNVLFGLANMTSFSVTITEGNYNINELLAAMKAAVDAAASVAAGGPVVTTWSYSRATGKATVTLNSSPSTLTLLYTSNTQLMRMMGFTSNIFLTVGLSQVSDIKVNVNPVSYIFIRSASLNQPEGSREALLSQGETTDILLDVPVTVGPGGIITYVNAEPGGVRLVNREVSEVQLYLSTNLNFFLDLGGVSWQIALTFTEVQPAPPPPDDLRVVNMRPVTMAPGADAPPPVPELPRGASDKDKAVLEELERKRAKAQAALEAERERLMARIQKDLGISLPAQG